MANKIINLIEIKQTTTSVLHESYEPVRFDSVDIRSMRVAQSRDRIEPLTAYDHNIKHRYAKKFIINNKPIYIVWSPELEELLQVPLDMFEQMTNENNKLIDKSFMQMEKIVKLEKLIDEKLINEKEITHKVKQKQCWLTVVLAVSTIINTGLFLLWK